MHDSGLALIIVYVLKDFFNANLQLVYLCWSCSKSALIDLIKFFFVGSTIVFDEWNSKPYLHFVLWLFLNNWTMALYTVLLEKIYNN